MARDLTGLQQQLLRALVESGLTRDALFGACDALYAKQAESTESTACASEAEQEDKAKPCSDLPQTAAAPGRSDALKIEEAAKQIATQDTRMEEQQMNFLDHMLRYVHINYTGNSIYQSAHHDFCVESRRKSLHFSSLLDCRGLQLLCLIAGHVLYEKLSISNMLLMLPFYIKPAL